MASLLALSDPRLLTAEEFLQIRFPDGIRAELDRGVIRMISGGSTAHARIQMNLYRYLGNALRGSGCRAYGSDAAIRTVELSLRYPDLTVACGPQNDEDADVLRDPCAVMEVLSPSTRAYDETTKLGEYMEVASLQTIVLIDPVLERVRIVQRRGPEEWNDRRHSHPTDVLFPSLGISIPHDEIFARD